MTTVAVICEYDPFHRGHALQIAEIRRSFGADATVVSLMSGNVVQRGRLALYPKHARAAAALSCGADLVLELPAPYACSGAEAFAQGAVELLHRLGGLDYLVFGSESGEITTLTAVAEVMDSPAYREALRQAPETESHPRYAEALFREMTDLPYPVTPNDILGVEYLLALRRLGSPITPYTYRREPGYSASAARTALQKGEDPLPHLPGEAWEVFSSLTVTDPQAYDAVALHTLRSTPSAVLERFSGMKNGVAGLLKNRAGDACSAEELVSLCTSRKFTAARLRRAVLAAVLAITPEAVTAPPVFTNLLGANETGRRFLRSRKPKTALAVVTKPADGLTLPPEIASAFEVAARADALMALARGEKASDIFKTGPVIRET